MLDSIYIEEPKRYNKRFSQMHQHAQFIEKLEGYDLRHIDDNQHDSLLEILDFLAQWLIGHIKGSDKKIPASN